MTKVVISVWFVLICIGCTRSFYDITFKDPCRIGLGKGYDNNGSISKINFDTVISPGKCEAKAEYAPHYGVDLIKDNQGIRFAYRTIIGKTRKIPVGVLKDNKLRLPLLLQDLCRPNQIVSTDFLGQSWAKVIGIELWKTGKTEHHMLYTEFKDTTHIVFPVIFSSSDNVKSIKIAYNNPFREALGWCGLVAGGLVSLVYFADNPKSSGYTGAHWLDWGGGIAAVSLLTLLWPTPHPVAVYGK